MKRSSTRCQSIIAWAIFLIFSTCFINPISAENLRGKVKIDGSSTVYPITEAVAEEFGGKHTRARVTVGFSGTCGGFKKFSAGEIDINDASLIIFYIFNQHFIQFVSGESVEFSEMKAAMDRQIGFIVSAICSPDYILSP